MHNKKQLQDEKPLNTKEWKKGFLRNYWGIMKIHIPLEVSVHKTHKQKIYSKIVEMFWRTCESHAEIINTSVFTKTTIFVFLFQRQ